MKFIILHKYLYSTSHHNTNKSDAITKKISQQMFKLMSFNLDW